MRIWPTLEALSAPARAIFVVGALAAVALGGPQAGAQGADTGVALTLTGGPGVLESVNLSLEDLESMPQTTIETETEFADGKVAYRGPLVRDVVALLGLDRKEQLRFTAANDYYVDIPTEDFEKYDVILALEANGDKLSRREKGPLWLMYPISDHEELLDPVYNSRLIWQVIRIEAP
jgi:hypothetical protein